MPSDRSCVYLVGAGPGDPGLLTVRALELIQGADVVVYDRLVSHAVIELIPAGVSRIFAGKSPGRHSLQQDEINELLRSLARRDRRVVRLKGGDPFVFGRGGEEAEYLARHRVAFEIVPGITSGVACAAYAGIPVTHRGVAHSAHFVTGHCRQDVIPEMSPAAVADPFCTLVVYMGLGHLEPIREALLAGGRPPGTPVALIERGTLPDQRVITTNLNAMHHAARDAELQPPTLAVIGKVVALAEALHWFGDRHTVVDGPSRVLKDKRA